MSLIYQTCEGTQAQRPPEIEVGETTAYYRKNIEQQTRQTEQGEISVWVYEEAQVPREEFPYIQSMSNHDDISANSTAIDEIIISLLEV